MYRLPLRSLLLLSCAAASACNSSTDAGSIQILIGEQTDTFTQAPPVTKIVVTSEVAADAGYSSTVLATAPYSATSIDLGTQDEETVATIEVAGEDANGVQLVYGQSVPVEFGALAGSPALPIFVQRLGQNANLPNPLADARPAPTLAMLSGRFLIEGGGSDSTLSTTTNVYDFAQFDEISGPPTLPVAAQSMPIVGTIALVISSTGAAYYDFSGSTDTQINVPPPTDGTYGWADVAGGQSIYDSYDNLWFVVGATQTSGTATQAVLELDTNDLSNSTYLTGNLHWISLSAPRLGASAAWVPTGDQLVVAGGSATAAGLEILQLSTSGASNGLPLAFPVDPSVGSGMSWQGEGAAVLVAGGVLPSGGDPGVRVLDPTCPTCKIAVWAPTLMCGATASGSGSGTPEAGAGEAATPESGTMDASTAEGGTADAGAPDSGATGNGTPCPLTLSSVFSYNEVEGFIVGSETATGTTPGLTHTFFLTSGGATEIPTRVPHTNASAIVSPVGSILIVGGNAELESFIPCQDGVCVTAGATDAGAD
jgi:hypothetical protein